MKEKLLQYIWQFQYYNKAELSTTSGQRIEIVFNGHFNHNQGPDFLQSKIKINDTVWVGNIEIHTRSSDWNCHRHSEDSNYNNIILHVVWTHDVEIKDMNGFVLPTLELQSRVSKILLHTYESLMNANSFIACEKQIHTVPQLVFYNWQERLIVERLERKSILIMEFLKENNYHWEETFWWLLARNFGITVNSDCFEKIARSIPFSLLTKHKNSLVMN